MRTIEGYDVKIFTNNVEDGAVEQVKNLMALEPFSDKKIRIMPDVHAGAGCVIGFTGDLGDKVIPNIVGVDIGCGMRVAKLGRVENIDFHALHEHIMANVPSGLCHREESKGFRPLKNLEMDIYREAKGLVTRMHCYRDLTDSGRINKSIGSLGGGNHFIELDRDDDGNVYLVVHTGSRNLGKQVANIYQEKAIKHMTPGAEEIEEKIKRTIQEYKEAGRRSELESVIKAMRKKQNASKPTLDPQLCYLEGEGREEYLHDMRLCQKWAVLNRRLIVLLIMEFFGSTVEVEEEFESVHNYIGDDNIIRKGAISAKAGEKGIIPMNMRDGALICVGKGNEDWNCSAPHGAGRVMSRAKAHAEISVEDFKASMQGIYSETLNDFTVDEAPMVYKPASEIIANVGGTVDIVNIVRPIFNFKASK